MSAAMLVILISASPDASAQGDSVLDTALPFFTRHDAAGVLERLDSVRPAPVSLAARERVLATLPVDGEITGLNETSTEAWELRPCRLREEMKRHQQLAVIREGNKHVAVRIGTIFDGGAVHAALIALEELTFAGCYLIAPSLRSQRPIGLRAETETSVVETR
jgi:hypothetical protein